MSPHAENFMFGPTELSPYAVMMCALWYYANVPVLTQYQAAAGEDYEPPVGDYSEELAARYRKGMHEWFACFDDRRRARWLKAAIDRYAHEAVQQNTVAVLMLTALEHR